MRLTRFASSFMAAAAMAFGTSALADSMTFGSNEISKSVTLSYDGYSATGGTTVNGLTGSATFTLTGIAGNTYTFDYSVTNTTSGAPVGSKITSLAFDADPTIASATSTGTFSQTLVTQSASGGHSTFLCFTDPKSRSCLNAAGGLASNQSGSGSFSLTFSSPVAEVTLSDFFVRYQSITGVSGITSGIGAGTISSVSTSGGTPIPEPGMVGLFGLGEAALVVARRRPMARAA